MKTLEFNVFSGGKAVFALEICAACDTKACIAACNVPNLACILVENDGLPALKVTLEEAARGACIECLACELDCQEKGGGGLAFDLPMPELDAHLDDLARQGVRPGFGKQD